MRQRWNNREVEKVEKEYMKRKSNFLFFFFYFFDFAVNLRIILLIMKELSYEKKDFVFVLRSVSERCAGKRFVFFGMR
jgi:hypothetical protein